MHNIDYEKLIPRLKDYLKARYPQDTLIYTDMSGSSVVKCTYDIDSHLQNNISQEIYQAGGGYSNNMEVREIFQVIMDISQEDKGFVRILEEVRDHYFGIAYGQVASFDKNTLPKVKNLLPAKKENPSYHSNILKTIYFSHISQQYKTIWIISRNC